LLLQFRKQEQYITELIEPWTEKLIDLNADIAMKRNQFISELTPLFIETFNKIAPDEEVELEYLPYKIPKNIINDKELIIKELSGYYNSRKDVEYHRTSTLFGPQKDELQIKLNSGIAKDYASQGQHKSLLISLKIAEFNYLKSYCNETPIILLDDIFAELDEKRATHVLEIIKDNNVQSFITSTNKDLLNSIKSDVKLINIDEVRDSGVGF
jgi:DNA replication and repair protein RecF